MKKAISLFLSLVLIVGMIPAAQLDMQASAWSLTWNEFLSKLADVESQYPTGSQRTSWPKGSTCHGYARWISEQVWGSDFANGNGTGWFRRASTSSSSQINALAPGDVIRFRREGKSWNHTIFITSISGDTIYYTDCNSDGNSTIKWNQTISKSTMDYNLKLQLYDYANNETEQYGYIAHYSYNDLSDSTYTEPPTYANLYIDKFSHKKDEVVTFTCHTDGVINNLWIYCPDGSPLVYQDIGLSKEITFGWVGHYRALVQTWNDYGNVIGELIDFVIGEPTYAELKIDKFSHQKDERVTFTALSDGDINNLWIYCPDGSPLIYQDIGQTKEITFGWIGHYQALVQTWNDSGNVISDLIDFVIGPPTYATLSSDKYTYQKNETATFFCDTDGDLNTVWIYYPDGSRNYYWNVGNSVQLSFAEAGSYRALVQTWNESGNVISEYISFVVKPSAFLVIPDGSSAIIDKNTHQITGLTAGGTAAGFEQNYVSVSGGSFEYEYPNEKQVMGTGTKIKVYDIEQQLVETYIVVIFGDINGDSWYDGTDAYFVSLVANGLIAQSALTDAQLAACDANHDGVIDANDVVLIEKAGLLLNDIDQNAAPEELKTNSVYLAYCSLIDQTVELVEPEQPVQTAEPRPAAQNLLTWFSNLFNMVLNWIYRIFNLQTA